METVVLTGWLEPTESDSVELPFTVPPGVISLSVGCRVSPEGVCDLGLLAPRGFRGWSGSARDSLTLAADAATPGYLPGPVEPGTWRVLLGPYVVPAGGMEYRGRRVRVLSGRSGALENEHRSRLVRPRRGPPPRRPDGRA